MSSEKIGIWLIGAWGGVATTAAAGLVAIQKKLQDETGLVSARPEFSDLDLVGWSQFVIGGHEIRKTSYEAETNQLLKTSELFGEKLISEILPELKNFDKNIRTGTLLNVGETIESLASSEAVKTKKESTQNTIERLKSDMQEFQKEHNLSQVIVINVSSTEPPLESVPECDCWNDMGKILNDQKESPLPASSLYAIASMKAGFPFLNFTPSVGSNLPALNDLAEQSNVLHMGRDGKTGETLMKSILAPMFADRNLNVMSWVGHNIFGNMDGKVLDDPVNKANKVHSKDHLLTEILGYKPQTLVSIEYIESMGDWKTAWDHIHFQGFMGTKMSLQFTWQGCDSILAAPLVLDLVRFTEREARRGTTGVMTFLSSFFKSPMGTEEPEFHSQYALLRAWAEDVRNA
jgi:myo-inositol-1-phosphate synthase